MKINIVAISDTHGFHKDLVIPDGDILIHAGDLTRHGSIDELHELNDYLGSLPHPHKIVIAGNHDFCFEQERESAASILTNAVYLQDQAVEIQGIKFYGSPWQPWFFNWAFNLHRGPQIKEKWDLIPSDTDVLITHGPPFGYNDRTSRNKRVGCKDLLAAVERIQPKVHIFGHIHEDAGQSSNEQTTFINASTCDLKYRAVNPPAVYQYELH